MATIRDVAKKADVSVATVSRVLNQSGYADETTRQRVLAAVESLGYRRNIHWSRLASKSSRTILFLLGNRDTLNSMQMRLLVACERALGAHGYDLVFTRFAYDALLSAGQLTFPRLLEQPGAVDGVILAGLHSENLLDALESRQLPYVCLANTFSGQASKIKRNCVLYDDESAVQDAAEYLMRLGHRRIAFVGNVARPWFARRFRGFERAARAAGFEAIRITENWFVSPMDYGQMAAAELTRIAAPPSAILAANDEIAAGVWKELARRQISIPAQVSLIGFGDRTEFSILEPSLTSVSVFEENLGERLGLLLLERLKSGRPVASETHPCKLVERQSCAPWKEPVPIRRPAGLRQNPL